MTDRLLLPLPHGRRARRLLQLYVGLALYGFSTALFVEAHLGLNPWDVLHQGLARLTGISIGFCTIAVGVVVLLLWIPLRQRPGLGTVSNAVCIGLAVDASLALLPTPRTWVVQALFLGSGIVLNGIATGMYIGAELGPGPRDGLMTGLSARTRRSIRLVRTSLEVVVLVMGVLLGGTIGVGTVAYALAIGPLAQVFLPLLAVTRPGEGAPAVPPDAHTSVS